MRKNLWFPIIIAASFGWIYACIAWAYKEYPSGTMPRSSVLIWMPLMFFGVLILMTLGSLAGEPKQSIKAKSICIAFAPPWFTGRWQDWHRGHDCDLDDDRPRTSEGTKEIELGHPVKCEHRAALEKVWNAHEELVLHMREVPRNLRNITEVALKWPTASDTLKIHWRDEADLLAARVEDSFRILSEALKETLSK